MPPSLQDWLPENHLAPFVAQVSAPLDLSQIYAAYQRRDGRGAEGYHPLLLVRLLLYAYCVGKPSSRQIEKATYDEVAFRYLAADQHPDHDTIASFRQRHLEQLAALFVQALQLCREAGLVKLGQVTLEGTKMGAQASRRKNVKGAQVAAQERMLAEKVKELLAEAGRVDAEEEGRYGKGRRGDELPAELPTAEPVFGQIKERRRFRRFSLRGLAKVKAEWALIGPTHNLLKLHQHVKTKAEGTSKAVRANQGKARRSQHASWNPHSCRTAA